MALKASRSIFTSQPVIGKVGNTGLTGAPCVLRSGRQDTRVRFAAAPLEINYMTMSPSKCANSLQKRCSFKHALSIRRGEFELGSATTQLIVFAFKFGMQPLPVVAGFLVIILIAQYGNDIQNSAAVRL